jgi:hypothetical protein
LKKHWKKDNAKGEPCLSGPMVFHINSHALAGTTKHETLEKIVKWS